MEWLAKEKIFIESDLLGVAKTTMIRYLTKMHPHLTNHGMVKQLVQLAFENIAINAILW